MILYIVLPTKYDLKDNAGFISKIKLPLPQMLKDLQEIPNIKAFNKWESATKYRFSLHNNGRLKKIILFADNHDTFDYPIFAIEMDSKKIKDLKKETLPKGLISEDLYYYDIKTSDIACIVSVDIGAYKNHLLRQLADFPIELLLRIANSNLALSDIGNLMLSQKKFHDVFADTKNPYINTFWLHKQNIYQPFAAIKTNDSRNFQRSYRKEVNEDHRFQYILNRAKEGDLSAFEKFNYSKYGQLIYNQEDQLGMTVLDWLKHHKHSHILQWLFKQQKLIPIFKQYYEFRDEFNLELFAAICLNQQKVIEDMIFDQNFSLDSAEQLFSRTKISENNRLRDKSIIGLAVAFSSTDVVKTFLHYDVTHSLKNKLLPDIDIYFKNNSYEICQILLELLLAQKYQKDEFEKKTSNLLHYAARNKDIRILKLLLDVIPQHINTKFTFPARHRKVIFLKSPFTKSFFENRQELTPLHITAYLENFIAMTLLLDKGANIDELANGKTALHLAAAHGKAEVVKFLLKHQANPFFQGDNNVLPIHLAIQSGSFQCVNLLLACHLKHNLTDTLSQLHNGNSVLHYAAQHPKILQLLLHANVDFNLLHTVNAEKKLPISLQLDKGCKSGAALLILYNADKNLLFGPNEEKQKKFYQNLSTFVKMMRELLAKYEANSLQYVLYSLNWYVEQNILSGYWFNDKPHVTEILKMLTQEAKQITDQDLLNYLNENLIPSDPNNELAIIKIILTEQIHNNIVKTNTLLAVKSEAKKTDKEEIVLTSVINVNKQEEDYNTRRMRMVEAAEQRRNTLQQNDDADENPTNSMT